MINVQVAETDKLSPLGVRYGQAPLWHDVCFEQNGKAVSVRFKIHRDVVGRFFDLINNSNAQRIREQLIEGAVFTDAKEGEAWSFDGVMQPLKTDEDWVAWQAVLPRILYPRSENRVRWDDIHKVSATLGFSLYIIAYALDSKIQSKTPQLFVVSGFGIPKGPSTAGFSATLAPQLCNWMAKSLTKEMAGRVVAMMNAVYLAMWPEKGALGGFGGMFENALLCNSPGYIHLNCPGNACGLDPKDYDTRKGELFEYGYDLVPHNVDSSLQQLTLLAGLTTLVQEAIKSGCGR